MCMVLLLAVFASLRAFFSALLSLPKVLDFRIRKANTK